MCFRIASDTGSRIILGFQESLIIYYLHNWRQLFMYFVAAQSISCVMYTVMNGIFKFYVVRINLGIDYRKLYANR